MGQIEVRDPDDGGVVEVAEGEELVVLLRQNASTGYVWRADPPGEGLVVLEEDDVAGGPEPGAAGWHRVVLGTAVPGSWTLELVLGRRWEDDPAERRRVTVSVR